jgi:predicted ATPase/type II secretory pathway predicted ATPase ExeA
VDVESQRLTRDDEEVTLRPRAFAVLRHLLEHAGQLITKDDLIRSLWAGAAVSDSVVKVCIREIRGALGESAKTPEYIETVPRRGYRFIADVTGVAAPLAPVGGGPVAVADAFAHVVGRTAEVAQLQGWLLKAEAGERQIVLVTGEAGSGKTTLVDLFLERADVVDRMRIGRGQCLERYGEGEAYLPVLEALGRLCREAGGNQLVELLRQYAPTWLVQMPALVKDAELETLQRKVQGTTHERMLREITEAIEAFTTDKGLVLVLEDLQWSDYSTLELVSYLAHRRERVRLMVIGTYRPAHVALRTHPLHGIKQELLVKGQCEEIALEPLTEAEVSQYVDRRLGDRPTPAGFGPLIHQRTDGNPLFMVNFVDFAMEQGLATRASDSDDCAPDELARSVPDDLRQMIEKLIDGLSGEARPLLEVASVAGVAFTAASVAAGERCSPDKVERQCDALVAREQLLRPLAARNWPDGTVSARYRFIHRLYQHVLYEQIGEARRVRIHRLIAERKEKAYGARVGEVAGELAWHFELGLDYERAIRYHRIVGTNELYLQAHKEAVKHLLKALELLPEVPESPQRIHEELALQAMLGEALLPLHGAGAPEVQRAYARAQELCQQVEDSPQTLPVMLGVVNTYQVQGKLRIAREIAERVLRLVKAQNDAEASSRVHLVLGSTLFWSGEIEEGRRHLEESVALAAAEHHGTPDLVYAFDARVRALSALSILLCAQGYVDQAVERSRESVALATEASSPFDIASALMFAAIVRQFRGEPDETEAQVDAGMRLAAEHSFALFVAGANFFRGWILSERGDADGGIVMMQEATPVWHEGAGRVLRAYFLSLLGAAFRKAGRIDDGLRTVEDALGESEETGGHLTVAELHRLKGELLLAQGATASAGSKRGDKAARSGPSDAEAEACFRHALETARGQGAKLHELRAAVSLMRLSQTRGGPADARGILAEVYGWFTEGFDLPDLKEAKALLDTGK